MAVVRLVVTLVAVAVAVGALAYSVWEGAPQTWRALDAEYRRFEPLPRVEREQAFVTLLPMPVDVFAWYREQLRPGDRYYVHGAPGGYSRTATLREVVRNVGRLYFVPAVEVDRVEDADAIVSWGADPAELGLTYCHQVRAGLQPYFVSRVRCGE
jgi:hypothetical protein